MILLQGWKERFHADRTNKDTDGCLKAIRQVEADHQIATRMQSDYNSSARAAPEQSGSKVAAPSSQPSSDALWSRSVKGEHSASHGMIPIPPSHRPLAPRSKQLAGSQDALNSASAAERAPVKPSSHDTAAYIDQAAADSGRLPKPPSSAAISSGQMPPAGSGSAHAELTAQSPVLPAASGVASGIPSAAASAEPRMPGGKVAPPARLRTTSAVPAVPSAAAASGFAQSASEVPLSALPLPAMPPATANPYAGKDVAPLVLPDNGGRSLEQLHQVKRASELSLTRHNVHLACCFWQCKAVRFRHVLLTCPACCESSQNLALARALGCKSAAKGYKSSQQAICCEMQCCYCLLLQLLLQLLVHFLAELLE